MPVDAGQDTVGFVFDIRLVDEVVAAGGVWQRHQRQNPGSDRIDTVRRNRAAGEVRAGQRIADVSGQNAAALGGGEYPSRPQHALLDAGAFVIEKEERAVLHQRPAGIAAELVLLVGRLWL